MIDKKLIERIHEDLEGKLNADERQQLTNRLSSDPEASAYFQDWKRIAHTIEKTREGTPDIQLTHEILNRYPWKHKPQENLNHSSEQISGTSLHSGIQSSLLRVFFSAF